MLFSFGKMYIPELFRTVVIAENSVAELFACQIKAASVCHVKAMKIPIPKGNAIHLSAENVLKKKSGDGALAERLVLR